MTFKEYQQRALKTAIYPARGKNFSYPALGLTGEAGEVAEKVKKIIRDQEGIITEENKTEILKECGDILWYLAAMAEEMESDLETIAEMSCIKLEDRQRRGVIGGSGDNR